MMWQKYTLDGWLEQFGAWCENTHMKGGNLPDGLHINQIYWLIQSANDKVKIKGRLICEISDKEADEVQNMLRVALKNAPDEVKECIKLLIKHKVEGQTLRALENKCRNRNKIGSMIDNGRYYLLGMNKCLILACHDKI